MDLTLSDFTAQLASAQPAPGGGGAAALTGALAASLAAMAANVTAANPRYAERSDALRSLIDACETQRTTLLALICRCKRPTPSPEPTLTAQRSSRRQRRRPVSRRWQCWSTAHRPRCC